MKQFILALLFLAFAISAVNADAIKFHSVPYVQKDEEFVQRGRTGGLKVEGANVLSQDMLFRFLETNGDGTGTKNTATDFSSGDDFFVVRWTFANSGNPLVLRPGYSLRVNLNDNLSALTAQHFQVQGYRRQLVNGN